MGRSVVVIFGSLNDIEMYFLGNKTHYLFMGTFFNVFYCLFFLSSLKYKLFVK